MPVIRTDEHPSGGDGGGGLHRPLGLERPEEREVFRQAHGRNPQQSRSTPKHRPGGKVGGLLAGERRSNWPTKKKQQAENAPKVATLGSFRVQRSIRPG